MLLGWAAGLLILLALPWFEPAMARAERHLAAGWRHWRVRRGRTLQALPTGGLPAGALAREDDTDTATAGRRPVAAAAGTSPAAPGASSPHVPGRPTLGRHERTPSAPNGSRRPPVDRARTTTRWSASRPAGAAWAAE